MVNQLSILVPSQNLSCFSKSRLIGRRSFGDLLPVLWTWRLGPTRARNRERHVPTFASVLFIHTVFRFTIYQHRTISYSAGRILSKTPAAGHRRTCKQPPQAICAYCVSMFTCSTLYFETSAEKHAKKWHRNFVFQQF